MDEEREPMIDKRSESNKKRENLIIKGSLLGNIKCRILIVLLFLLLAAVCIAVGVVLAIFLSKKPDKANVRAFRSAAVATDSEICSTVGADVLREGGSAVDAAIASSFCVGVVNIHSTGIGGGGFLVYYNATNKSSIMIDFREVAPAIIDEETMEKYKNDSNSTTQGGMACAVPGQVKGLYEAWARYGNLSWGRLIEPSIKLTRDGFKVTKAIANAIKAVESTIRDDRFQGLRRIVIPNGKPLVEGDLLVQKNLSKTLEMIAKEGPDYFYNSSFTNRTVTELQADGSVLTLEDLQNYEVVIRETIVTQYDEYAFHTTNLPGGGPLISLIFNILDGYDITPESFRDDPVLAYHRLVEAFRFTYAQRLHLGDPDFNETVRQVLAYMIDPSTADMMRSRITDDASHEPDYYIEELDFNPPSHGTSHLSVYHHNGDAVATTHTINTYFGSLICSSDGVIFNDEMDDFSVEGRNNSFGYPPTPANYLRPGRRPLSSMSPTIVVNTKDNKVKITAGASGGSMIPTNTAQVILDLLGFGMTLETASPYPRLHDQLLPDVLIHEPTFPSKIVEGLLNKSHNVVESNSAAIVQAIYVDNGLVHAASDARKGGKPDGY